MLKNPQMDGEWRQRVRSEGEISAAITLTDCYHGEGESVNMESSEGIGTFTRDD